MATQGENDDEEYYNSGIEAIERGDYHAAEQAFRKAREIQVSGLSLVDYETARSSNFLAISLWKLGKLDEAVKYFREALPVYRMEDNNENNLIQLIQNLSSVQQDLGNLDDAEKRLLEALSLQQEFLGPQHPDVGFSLQKLGILLNMKGNIDKADFHFNECLRILKQFSDDKKMKKIISSALENLAGNAEMRNDHDKACSLLLEALESREEDEPEIINIYIQLCIVEQKKGNFMNAKNYLHKAQIICEKLCEVASKYNAEIHKHLGCIYLDTNELKLSEKHLLLAFDYYRAGKYSNLQQAFIAGKLSNLYGKLKDIEKQKQYIEIALALTGTNIRTHDPTIVEVMENAGKFYRTHGNLQKAKQLYKELIRVCKGVYGDSNPRVHSYIDQLELINDNIHDQEDENASLGNILLKKDEGVDITGAIQYSQKLMELLDVDAETTRVKHSTSRHCSVVSNVGKLYSNIRVYLFATGLFLTGVFTVGSLLYLQTPKNR